MTSDAVFDNQDEVVTLCSSRSEYVDHKATDVKSIIKVDKPVLAMSVEGQLSFYEAHEMQRLYKEDNRIDVETYRRMKGINIPTLVDIKKKFSIGFQYQLDYLDQCWKEQCIRRCDAVILWRDYLETARKMKYRLKDKSIKYPDSLKREYDKVMYAYSLVEQECQREKFAQKVRADKKYEHENEVYSIICPQTAEDLISEGNTLHHCVGSYVDAVIQDETSILFLRKKEEPDKPFFTIEVRNGELLQAKGQQNRLLSQAIMDYLVKWTKEKNILYTGNF